MKCTEKVKNLTLVVEGERIHFDEAVLNLNPQTMQPVSISTVFSVSDTAKKVQDAMVVGAQIDFVEYEPTGEIKCEFVGGTI